jgi:enoyl-CoA hydratase
LLASGAGHGAHGCVSRAPLLSADYRVGRNGPFRIGLNETGIGMALPNFAVVLATHRLERRFLTVATMFARVVAAEQAVEMGYLDESVDDPLARAHAVAAELKNLPPAAFAGTKRRIRRGLQQDLEALKRRDPSGRGES